MDRTGNERTGNRMLNIPVKAGVELNEATMAVINADGYAEKASAAEGVKIAGCVHRYGCHNNAAHIRQPSRLQRRMPSLHIHPH